MQDKKRVSVLKRILAFILGLFMIQVGVALFLKVNIGSDPFTVFTQGLSKVLHITPGMANRIITIILLVLVLFLDRQQIKLGSIVAVLCAGTFLDGALFVLTPLFSIAFPMPMKLFLFLLGSLLVGIGFPLLKSADFGVAPNDSAYFVIVDRLEKPYGIIRMGVDSLYMVVGFLFGGVIGIGTVFCILLIGPIIQFFLTHLQPYFDRYYGITT